MAPPLLSDTGSLDTESVPLHSPYPPPSSWKDGWMDLQYTSQRAHPKNLGRIFCGRYRRPEIFFIIGSY